MTPLIIASLNGHAEVAAGLIEAHADINHKNKVRFYSMQSSVLV